jgi:hypothetical protein
VRSSAGRVLFNSIIPDELGYLNRTFGKKELGDLVFECFTVTGLKRTTEFLDALKDFGFRYATMGGLSVGIEDLEVPKSRRRDPEGSRRAGLALPEGVFQRLHLERRALQQGHRYLDAREQRRRGRHGAPPGAVEGRLQPGVHDDELRRAW